MAFGADTTDVMTLPGTVTTEPAAAVTICGGTVTRLVTVDTTFMTLAGIPVITAPGSVTTLPPG